MSSEMSTAGGNVSTTGNAKRKSGHEDDSSDDDGDTIDVDFEWFDPQEIDFHGLKLLLRQLFDVDNDLFDLSALSNLIIAQPLLGSTVKVPEDGVETHHTDPFAFLTIFNLHTHRDKPEIKALVDYLTTKCLPSSSLSHITHALAPSSEAQVGLILSERFINMPPQIVPPMYSMLLEEIRWALDEGEPYSFTHYLVVSKIYTEIASKIDNGAEAGPQRKKSRSARGAAPGETFYFHAEDEVFHKHALAYGNFQYTTKGADGASDAKRVFQDAGIEPAGHMILVEADKFEAAVNALDQYINSVG